MASATFVGTFFTVKNPAGECLNCLTGVQTVDEYWSPEEVKAYVEQHYPDYWKIHIKYFMNAMLDQYVYKNGQYVYIGPRSAELWSEANYERESNSWTKTGYPDYPNGGASFIVGKRLYALVGLHYYRNFTLPAVRDYRRFGHPVIFTLYSTFGHQFLIRYATRW